VVDVEVETITKVIGRGCARVEGDGPGVVARVGPIYHHVQRAQAVGARGPGAGSHVSSGRIICSCRAEERARLGRRHEIVHVAAIASTERLKCLGSLQAPHVPAWSSALTRHQ